MQSHGKGFPFQTKSQPRAWGICLLLKVPGSTLNRLGGNIVMGLNTNSEMRASLMEKNNGNLFKDSTRMAP